jgi:dipeptidyl-peptidase-4
MLEINFMKYIKLARLFLLVFTTLLFLNKSVFAQYDQKTNWSVDGNKIMDVREGNIVEVNALDGQVNILVNKVSLQTKNQTSLDIVRFAFSDDKQQVLLNTNTKKVWRYDTRGDYWVYNLTNKTLKQIGAKLPESSLMFAKFSPDAKKVAYVSNRNLYVEDLTTGKIKPLTKDSNSRLINGTFDWVYEEEFDCRDGFRWSPDGKNIAYWQIDASTIKNYLMINNTDSLYPFTVPVEYPVVGQNPSSCKIGVVNIETATTKWMKVQGSTFQNYIPRMEWANNSKELILQQLNRRQNQSNIILANILSGETKTIFKETDKAWIDAKSEAIGWDFIENGKSFIWQSEMDGWRHLYAIDLNGKSRLLTKCNFDVIKLLNVNEKTGQLYFMASPDNATQSYLYKVNLSGDGIPEKISPPTELGTHEYDISPNGKLAFHSYSNSTTSPISDVVELPSHLQLVKSNDAEDEKTLQSKPEFLKVKTVDGITMDGWMVKPDNFDPSKKYPIVFYVYGEPGAQTVNDVFGIGLNNLYAGSMAKDGYIYVSFDGRGSPAPKGRMEKIHLS